MDRDKITRQLERMLAAIDSLPVKVREFYVFGSYARGALDPGDLDVLVLHERPSEEVQGRFGQKDPLNFLDAIRAYRKMQAETCRRLRKPGERIDIILTERLEEWVSEEGTIKPADLVLLWSPHSPNWRANLAGIAPDPTVGSAERDHFFSIRRLNADLAAMREVAALLQQQTLLLNRIPVESVDWKLTPLHADWYDRWYTQKSMGKKSLECAPYALWWLQQHKKRLLDFPDDLEFWSHDRTHRAHIGKPSPRWMVHVFETQPQVVRQCLIPHLKRGGPNEILVFERGPNWSLQRQNETAAN